MTIRKGEPWGIEVDRPEDLLVVDTDAGLADALEVGRPLALSGGDLYRSLGEPASRARMQRVDVDLLRVTADDTTHTAVAHVVARRSWWWGPIVAVMNVDHLGDWNVAPRAHPNDGFADVVEVDARMGVRQRWQAHSRLGHGTHVPHPSISTRRVRDRTWRFERPLRLWVDGEPRGEVSDLSIDVVADAFALHI